MAGHADRRCDMAAAWIGSPAPPSIDAMIDRDGDGFDRPRGRLRSLAVADSPLRVIITPYESPDSRVIGHLMLSFATHIAGSIQE